METNGKEAVIISVKAARVNANKTQQEVADLIGVGITAYKRKENGKARFYADELAMISRYFGIKIENFFEVQCLKKTQKKGA